MAVIEQRTASVGDESQTLVLKQLQNTFDQGGRYMYRIEDKDTGEQIDQVYFKKRKAKQEFQRSIEDIERGMESGGGMGFKIPGVADTSGPSTDDTYNDLFRL